jgi:hypothetical protein
MPPAARAAFPGIEWRAPCEAGDLLRLGANEQDAVCIIDGWFDHRPAVRHKEILFLLARGVRIFGASSIGALRAVEMARFGMIGIGRIFSAYAAGRLTGDDEVALVHGSEEQSWRDYSVPLVEVRLTLASALRAALLAAGEARHLLDDACSLHYVDRSWEELLQCRGLSRARAAALLPLLRRAHVRPKLADARLCLEAALAGVRTTGPRAREVRTIFLEELARECAVDLDAQQPAPRL